MHAAVKLGLFSVLGDELLTAEEVALKLGASERGVVVLLNALVAMELLEKESFRFQNTPLSLAFLDRKSSRYVGHIVMHHHHLVDGWAQLDQAVMTGQPVETKDNGEEREREAFQMGMFNLAMAIAPTLSKDIDLAGRKHLLDLGGGPGTHAIHFCLANPELTATVYDRPTTKPFAEETAKKFGVAERINFESGDFIKDSIPGKYDVVWLSQVLHSNNHKECRRLIEKTVSVVEPGGLIMIHDFFLNDTMDGPLFPALFSLNMLLNNQGRSYSDLEVRDMLEKAGVGDIERLPFQGANDSAVICGIV